MLNNCGYHFDLYLSNSNGKSTNIYQYKIDLTGHYIYILYTNLCNFRKANKCLHVKCSIQGVGLMIEMLIIQQPERKISIQKVLFKLDQ